MKGFEDIRIRVCDAASVWTEFTPLRRTGDSVFDKRLNVPVVIGNVRAQSLNVLTKYAVGFRADGEFVRSEQISGFKREFDPGSESTLAACLTHASRTRKWSNP